MKNLISRSFFRRTLFLLVFSAVLGLAGQLVSAQTGAQYNLFKEVMAKKDTIVWKNAPDTLIPAPVCTLLQVCAGNPDRFIALAPVTEGGQKVARGLFLTKDAKRSETVMMLYQALDVYFFLVSPDGTLQKAAYHQAGATSWLPIANSLAQPAFDKDKKIWHDRIAQLGGAPAPAAAAPAKPATAQ
jgi:hypothetical protein